MHDIRTNRRITTVVYTCSVFTHFACCFFCVQNCLKYIESNLDRLELGDPELGSLKRTTLNDQHQQQQQQQQQQSGMDDNKFVVVSNLHRDSIEYLSYVNELQTIDDTVGCVFHNFCIIIILFYFMVFIILPSYMQFIS